MSHLLRLACVLFCVSAAVAEASFFPTWDPDPAVEIYRPDGIAHGDFNSDGRPDVVIDAPFVAIYVLLTSADGTLGTPVSVYPSGARELVVADATGDGKADIVLAQWSPDAIVVLPSNGDGTFGTPVTSPVAFDLRSLAAADFTGDGKVDLVLDTPAGAAIGLCTGDGAGSFALTSTRTTAAVPTVVVAGDIDADGHNDYFAGYRDSKPYEVSFGKGDGTFHEPVAVSSVMTGALRAKLADLDADGDLEILIPHFAQNKLTVIVNHGSRTFAAPVSYDALASPSYDGNPLDLIVVDADDDGHADVVMTLNNEDLLGTYTGNGDGSLNPGTYQRTVVGLYDGSFPRYLTAADFSNDGRTDIVTTNENALRLWRNGAGETDVTVSSSQPTITAGQSVTLSVKVQDVSSGSGPTTFPKPTGTVTFKRDGAEIGTVTLDQGLATIEVPSLPAGTHELTAHYSGDDAYRPKTSAVTQHVVAESTTVTVTSSSPGEEVPYTPWFEVSATVTSPINAPLNGRLLLYVDGVRKDPAQNGPAATWNVGYLSPGTHTFVATFEGTAQQPPSTSEVFNQVFKKAESVTTVTDGAVRRFSQQTTVEAEIGPRGGGTPGGNVHLYEGSTHLATVFVNSNCCSGGVTVNIPINLPVGVHFIHAVYDGDLNFEPSNSTAVKYTVRPDGDYTFTEEPLAPGSVMKAVHISELVTAINVMRSVAGLGLIAIEDAGAGQVIRASHLLALRTAINEVRTARLRAPHVFSGDLAAGSPIRAIHIQELRDAVE